MNNSKIISLKSINNKILSKKENNIRINLSGFKVI